MENAGKPERGQRPLAEEIAEARAPEDGFSVWFLSQNSFILKDPRGTLVAIDPYLSDWCATRGKSKERTSRSRLRPPLILPEELDVDLVLLTHSHCDHADPETLAVLASKGRVRCLCPHDALLVARTAGFPEERLSLAHAGQEYVMEGEGGIRIRSTFALPTDGTDLNHLGFFIRFSGGATFWDTGDSAWCDTLPSLSCAALGAAPDVMAVCINAGYGNLSHWDASRLAGAAKARFAVPAHWDLFPHNRCDPFPFKISLERNAPDSVYAPMEEGVRYDFAGGVFAPAAKTGIVR
ncbi:MAG: hypothetical protein A2Z99_21055 [Treponema sp. GWB1_62_6]|nr:MAG: hypothetical protein A2Z99_21055 [Treponema sp. GWB1_62_6]OHE67524.1 MAG: hypothetical protein A2Y36_05150 [Treponema sp. GWA1_62_8]OHE76410.1 MAG: hypothetical protein A2413_04985 [Treponema sp. RIFOXYC1_FULL_61_9]HCM27896.1 MBL fold metallo-hydrolase [Treponema sp.]